MLLAAGVIVLPSIVEQVREVHLSIKDARFVTGSGEVVAAWDSVRAVIHAHIHKTEVQYRTVKEFCRTGSKGGGEHTSQQMMQVDEVEPIIEVRVGGAPARVRIHKGDARLFEYLGSRAAASSLGARPEAGPACRGRSPGTRRRSPAPVCVVVDQHHPAVRVVDGLQGFQAPRVSSLLSLHDVLV
ncbi:MAG: hypothetical protein HY815_19090 [Candidatus Riflebacteria bacterium]|nr:hypothetical protein [Candidatus Riflebacteria bacterium]